MLLLLTVSFFLLLLTPTASISSSSRRSRSRSSISSSSNTDNNTDTSTKTFSTCASPSFRGGDYLDFDKVLYDCMDHLPSTLFPPSYHAAGATNISIQVALNNIIHVNDLNSQFTMDFFFRIVWTDPRLNMPGIWPHLHPKSIQEGIEISKYFRMQNQLQFWLPDIYFAQSAKIKTLNNLIKLKQNGLMFWARQMIVTFSNPQMPFSDFPNDVQSFTIMLESFSYDSDFIRLFFPISNNGSVALDLLTDYQNNKPIVHNNQIWMYQGYTSFLLTTSAPSPTNPSRTYSTAFINIRFRRQSHGVIYRLALPILIFLVIVGSSFWSNEHERIEVTLQIIFVVAAMYGIIGRSIPFVGYLTKMDLFIIAVFAILAATISVHFLTTVLSRKASKYPLNTFFRDALVIMFRGLWMPLSLALFIYFFGKVHYMFLVTMAVCALGCLLFFKGKFKLLYRTFFVSLKRLSSKSNLVSLGELDDKTELPLKLTLSEKLVLKLMNCTKESKSSSPQEPGHEALEKQYANKEQEAVIGQSQLRSSNSSNHPELLRSSSGRRSNMSVRSHNSAMSLHSAAADSLMKRDSKNQGNVRNSHRTKPIHSTTESTENKTQNVITSLPGLVPTLSASFYAKAAASEDSCVDKIAFSPSKHGMVLLPDHQINPHLSCYDCSSGNVDSPHNRIPEQSGDDADYSSSESDSDLNEMDDKYHEDGDVDALIRFKQTIAKEMGAVFTKREDALQFVENDSIKATAPSGEWWH